MNRKTAIIIGAGPAGLTMAYELLARAGVTPIVLEAADYLGGISRTATYKGNRIDIGGHRFFSKSDRVMQWWLDRLPLERVEGRGAGDGGREDASARQETDSIPHPSSLTPHPSSLTPHPEQTDRVMLLRSRKSRIYYLRRFFDYPLQLNFDTVRKLGFFRMVRIGMSYLKAAILPYKNPSNLEQFFINRFGRELYLTFFKGYTEKVWGEPCENISAEWGAQRVKGLSIRKALAHFFGKAFRRSTPDIASKQTETSLIEQFFYPKYGPGQMWELVAKEVQDRGGEVRCHQRVTKLMVEGNRVVGAEAVDDRTGQPTVYRGDYTVSTMPIKDLVRALQTSVPQNVREVAEGLVYRDFITVGLLLSSMHVRAEGESGQKLLQDNWIYIQEPDVLVGRLQIFNNWSPYMVADPSKVWIGLEYFCNDTDALWKKPDGEMIALAKAELAKLGFIEESDVLDGVVIHMPKTYPAYFGTYNRLDEVRQFLDGFENLFLIGRNGMHRYNNQDHSMLTAMVAVDNLVAGRTDKANIWAVNTEQEYHEESGEQ